MSRALASVLLGLALIPALPAAAQRCEIPRVLLTVDRSSSMLGPAADGISKWQATETAIGEVTGAYEGRIDFGLQVFPYPDRCEPGEVVLDFGPHAAMDVVDALGGPPPTGGNWTPMAQTLDAAASYLGPMAAGLHMILVTDGWQWCDPYSATTRFLPVDAVSRLRAAGVTVHVVGFGDGVDSLTLNRAAVAAGTAMAGCDPTLSDPHATGHCYTQANDLVELRTELERIARLVTTEICDGIDSDCDGLIDEGFDLDGDGYTTCGTLVGGGTDTGYVDCNDADAAVNPGATELCNAVDDDCDGVVDPGCDCTMGDTLDCGSSVGACSLGAITCGEDGTWGVCEGAVEPVAEICNGLDDDCDGTTDEDSDSSCDVGSACVGGECVPLVPDEPVDPTPVPDEPTGGPDYPNDGGCACSAAGSGARGNGAGAALLGLGLALTLAARRRR